MSTDNDATGSTTGRSTTGGPATAGLTIAAPVDVLVIGSGVAGLSAALAAAPRRVLVVTKTAFGSGSSSWAQGGVAVALGDGDSPALHASDTVAVGVGLNDSEAVRVLTAEGPARARQLLALGARFDRDDDGELALGREAAHSVRRIVHAADATGAEIVRTLRTAAVANPTIEVVERSLVLDLLVDPTAPGGARVVGALAADADGRLTVYRAGSVVLATGGSGRLYSATTNPIEATADGLALAVRAGATLRDLEFVQFHPTALAAPGVDPLPLVTEALRGEGATIVDETGRRFLTDSHPAGELAPRDVVARAIAAHQLGGHRVFLDARASLGDRLAERFPTVYTSCLSHGIDARRDLIPVSPAAHYHMGGVATDLDGRTDLPGLFAAGEVATTGVHGANRLASNSLLEGMVFGARAGTAAAHGAEQDHGADGPNPADRADRADRRGRHGRFPGDPHGGRRHGPRGLPGAAVRPWRYRGGDPPRCARPHPYYEELALRFAEHGIDAVAIDWFGRTAGVARRDPNFAFMPHVEATTWAGVAADIRAGVAALRGDGVRSVCTLGFCMGGRMSFLAGTLGLDLIGVIGLYGTLVGPWRNDAPEPVAEAAAGRMASSILGLFGGADASIAPEHIEAFDAALAGSGVEHRLVTYPGAPHSFFDRKSAEFADASVAAWEEITGFIGAHTVPG